MENENTQNLNTPNKTSPVVETVQFSKKKLSKKMLILIIVASVLLVALVVYYFISKTKNIEPYIPTLEEKVNAVEETINLTKELGLPPIDEQVDIMNYNLQD